MEATRSPALGRAPARLVPIFLLTLSLTACFDGGSSKDTTGAQAGAIPTTSTGATATNGAPKVDGIPASEIPAGFPYVFRTTVVDPEGDPVVLSASGVPAWATFDPATGELRGTPTDADAGTSGTVMLTATDGKATTTFGPFKINVKRPSSTTTTAGARPPTISGTPSTTATAGTGYLFQTIASDPDGDKLVFGASNLPAWLGLNTANGLLTGTPTAAQVGTYPNITISVTDGNTTASLPAFTITVSAAGATSGTSSGSSTWTQCATEGGSCSFTGTRQVRYGEPFNNRWTAPRTLTGPVPCTNDFWTDPSPGTGKRCEVLDSLSLAPSTTTTSPTTSGVTGSATLIWLRPSQNTDGTALVDLAGYVIKYGTDPASLNQTLQLPGADNTRYTLQNLGPGTWYFTVSSYTTSGVESDLAPMVNKTIS